MIRPATAADTPAILEIWNQIIRDTAITFNSVEKTPEDIAALLAETARDAYPLLVTESAGQVEGFATYKQFRGGIGYAQAMEHTIYLADTARGNGLGRALLTAIEDHARNHGAHSLYAGVSAENPQGRAFHQRAGYTELALLPQVGFKFGRWMDLVLMQKFLT